jgi:hypothetical protein
MKSHSIFKITTILLIGSFPDISRSWSPPAVKTRAELHDGFLFTRPFHIAHRVHKRKKMKEEKEDPENKGQEDDLLKKTNDTDLENSDVNGKNIDTIDLRKPLDVIPEKSGELESDGALRKIDLKKPLDVIPEESEELEEDYDDRGLGLDPLKQNATEEYVAPPKGPGQVPDKQQIVAGPDVLDGPQLIENLKEPSIVGDDVSWNLQFNQDIAGNVKAESIQSDSSFSANGPDVTSNIKNEGGNADATKNNFALEPKKSKLGSNNNVQQFDENEEEIAGSEKGASTNNKQKSNAHQSQNQYSRNSEIGNENRGGNKADDDKEGGNKAGGDSVVDDSVNVVAEV